MLSAAVVPITDCSSAHVLCLCGGLGSSLLLCLLSSFGILSCLLLALLVPFHSSFLPSCCVCSVGVLFSFFDSAGRFARVLRTCSSAHSAQSDSVLLVSSHIVRRLSSTSCCVRQSGVASFLLKVVTSVSSGKRVLHRFAVA